MVDTEKATDVAMKLYSTVTTGFAGVVVGSEHVFDVSILSGVDSTGLGVIGFTVLTGTLVGVWSFIKYILEIAQ